MKIYEKYIFFKMFTATSLILLAMSFLVWITQIIKLVSVVSEKYVSLWLFLKFSSFIFPYLVFIIIPFALFFAGLFVYNSLVANSEMIILKISGLSSFKLLRPSIFNIAIFTALSLFLSLYFMPYSYNKFRTMQDDIKNEYALSILQPGKFVDIGNISFYINSITDGNVINNLMLTDNRDINRITVITAEKAYVTKVGSNIGLLLIKGVKKDFYLNNSDRVVVTNFETANFLLSYFMRPLDASQSNVVKKPREMYINELTSIPRDFPHYASYKRELHMRFTWPLYGIIIALSVTSLVLTNISFKLKHYRSSIIASILLVIFLTLETGILNAVEANTELWIVSYIIPAAILTILLFFIYWQGRRNVLIGG